MDFSREMATDKQVAQELLEKHVMQYYCDFITGRQQTGLLHRHFLQVQNEETLLEKIL